MSLNDALKDEIEALTSIYDFSVIEVTTISSCVLRIPETAYSFTLTFPTCYPDEPPTITGTYHVDAAAKRGEGDAATTILRDVLGSIFAPGQVCLFDLIEEAKPLLTNHHEAQHGTSQDPKEQAAYRSDTPPPSALDVALASDPSLTAATASNIPPPQWAMSEPLVVNRSTFIGRCVAISSLQDATSSISHLLSTNKKIASATHNITAWRIKTSPAQQGGSEIVIQDSDDDGETAAGGRLLHLMQLMDVWNIVVVVTRWYGGVKLGPDRFRCINAVARECLVNGGFVKEDKDGKSGKKGKK